MPNDDAPHRCHPPPSTLAIFVFVVYIVVLQMPCILTEWRLAIPLDSWSCPTQQSSHHDRARRNCTSPSLLSPFPLIGGGGMEQNDPPCRLPNIEHRGPILHSEICRTIVPRSMGKNLQCAILPVQWTRWAPLILIHQQRRQNKQMLGEDPICMADSWYQNIPAPIIVVVVVGGSRPTSLCR